ncbi:ATP/GTP-binding protein, partial [Paenibacillus apiarius]|nr:ATP/GTP-binding protein [Paenibacillus apiarius]
CSTCSVLRVRTGSGSSGTSWSGARSARWCWSTPAGSPTASPSIDFFEGRGTPFVVAVNCFEGAKTFRLDEVQAALDLDPGVPVVLCDARKRESAKEVLITLLEHAMKLREARRRAAED